MQCEMDWLSRKGQWMMKRRLYALALGCLMCLGLSVAARGAVEEVAELRINEVVAYDQESGIYTVREDGRYGLLRADGSQVLATEYVAVEAFSDGLAAVSLSGEWTNTRTLQGGRFGYVNADGEMVVPMRYSRAFPYAEGRAFAVDAASGKLVLLDELGQELAAFPEAEVLEGETVRFSEGLAILPVRAAREEAESEEPEETGEPEENAAETEPPLVYLVVDAAGRRVRTLTDAYVDFAGGYHDGMVAVAEAGEWVNRGTGRRFVAAAGTWGYRNEKGELAVDCRYASAKPFSGGLAAISEQNEEGETAYGFINARGETVIPAIYEAVELYQNGLCALRQNGKWAYADLRGRTLTGFIFDRVGEFREGAALAREGGRLRAVDEQGRTLFTAEAVEGKTFSGGITVLKRSDGLWGVYDRDGGELVPFEYEEGFHWDGYLWLKRGDMWRVYRTEDVIEARQALPEGESVDVSAFVDVPPDSWYAAAVTWATDHDVITGTGGGQFSPDRQCTIGEVVTFLWRAMGRPEPTTENPFTDVTPNHYYYQAALWAYAHGMVEGDVFGAAQLCTRSMAVTYLWKLAGSPQGETVFFFDIPADAPYAQAVSWAVQEGVTAGSGGENFAPGEICSRGQIVTFLHRYLTKE